MAEGGSSREVSDSSTSEVDSLLLDCPICLEQLHQPKSLPCLHSFCQECLSTFIVKVLMGKMASATSFPCPVCRKQTHPVNVSEGKEKWAQQFPTSGLVKNQRKVTTHERMYCKPCEKKGIQGTPASIWCKTCNVLFCDTCKSEYHDLFLEGCETVDVTGKVGMIQRQEIKQVRCGCLSTFIVKDLTGKMASATSFSCPVCRKQTHPVNVSEEKEKWAQQFPTSGLIKNLRNVTIHEPMHCKPCGKKGIQGTPASIWCKTCNVLFCEICKVELHDLIHDESETVDVTGKVGMIQRQKTKQVRCGKHTEKMDYYCEDHQVLGCSRCIIIDHRRCDVVTTTQEYCDKLKRESRLDDLETSMKKTMEGIELLIKEFGEKLQTLLEDKDAGLKSLTDLRQRIDTRLDAMQKNVTDELISIYKEEKNYLDMYMQKSERLTFSIQNTIESSLIAVQKNDNLDTILLYQRGQSEVKSCEDLLTEMRKSFTSARIKHIVDPDLLTVDKGIPLSMGEIRVEKNPVRLPGLLAPRLSECGVTEVNKFCIKCPSDVSECHAPGVVYLPDDHIVIGDYNNKKIKLFTVQGKHEDEMKVQGRPYDMCRVDDHTVAVANYDGFVTYVIRVESTKLILTSEIKLSNNINPWGITPKGDGFVVSSWGKLYNVQLNGNTQQIQTFPASCYHLVFDPRSSYMYISQFTSQHGSVAVYRLSDGTRTDLARVGTLNGAMGVDVDVEGNVYICGNSSNNVVQMSEDGIHVRELLTSSDGLDIPRAISVCGNKFVVTNQSSGNRNYVQVFELC